MDELGTENERFSICAYVGNGIYLKPIFFLRIVREIYHVSFSRIYNRSLLKIKYLLIKFKLKVKSRCRMK